MTQTATGDTEEKGGRIRTATATANWNHDRSTRRFFTVRRANVDQTAAEEDG